jgi:glycosyltransferase involved in cell wall biosynthesis
LIPQDGWGGVETAARSAAESRELSCPLTVMFLAGPTLANDKSQIIDHPGRHLNQLSTYLAAVREVRRMKPDVLICSLWRSLAVGIAVKILRPSTRLVCFLHSTVPVHLADRVIHWIGAHLADAYWADSRETLSKRPPRNRTARRVISFVLDHPVPPDQSVATPKFINWSRLHAEKGHDRSIRLIAALLEAGVQARLEIWGADNGEGPALSKLADALGVAKQVTFCGPVERCRIPQLAAKNSFYLQLSRFEGMAMSTVEAMQLGLVPIATPVGEMRNYIRDDENGLLVNAEDAKTAAARIKQLLQAPERYARMSAAAAATWKDATPYSQDICAAASELAQLVDR